MKKLMPIYCGILLSLIVLTVAGSRTVSVISENQPFSQRQTVVLDAGHGGVDGGTTSVTGIPESQINLEITQRLDDLLHLMGVHTIMIREDDRSIHTEGSTIAAKKISDLKQRVKITNETERGLLVSIHQNYYSDGRYSGAQVFYPNTPGSEEIAKKLQASLIKNLNRQSNRQAKQVSGVYLMEHIQTTGILVECGFLSNPTEEALLRSAEYQKKLCCVIASELSCYLSNNTTS